MRYITDRMITNAVFMTRMFKDSLHKLNLNMQICHLSNETDCTSA